MAKLHRDGCSLVAVPCIGAKLLTRQLGLGKEGGGVRLGERRRQVVPRFGFGSVRVRGCGLGLGELYKDYRESHERSAGRHNLNLNPNPQRNPQRPHPHTNRESHEKRSAASGRVETASTEGGHWGCLHVPASLSMQ